MGAITPIGIGLENFWNGLLEGRSGAEPITQFDTSKFDTKFAAQVNGFHPEDYLDRKSVRRLDVFAQFALVSSMMAIEHSGLQLDKISLERFGVIYGSGIGGMQTLQNQHWIQLPLLVQPLHMQFPTHFF
jgi:3-oxoacyl-[acyl-carrier-protein] synthase II